MELGLFESDARTLREIVSDGDVQHKKKNLIRSSFFAVIQNLFSFSLNF